MRKKTKPKAKKKPPAPRKPVTFTLKKPMPKKKPVLLGKSWLAENFKEELKPILLVGDDAPPVTGATMGERVRNLRTWFGYTQAELAKHLEIGVRTLTRIENNGYRNMELKTLMIMAESFGVTTDELLGMHLAKGQ